MALLDRYKLAVGTPIVLADASHAPSANNNLGSRTDQLNLASVANNAARQSDKIDFGSIRAPVWSIGLVFEFAATPTAGFNISVYLAPSNNATAAVANPGGVSGADGAYTGGNGMVNGLRQLLRIGAMRNTGQSTATVQIQYPGTFVPPERYGTIVVENQSGAAFHSSAVQMSIVLTPIEHERHS